MKILHLTIKKKWFDLIAEGKKKTEYRKVKPHWSSRLVITYAYDQPWFKPFDEVHFRNGYRPDSPFMRVVCRKINIVYPLYFNPRNGEDLQGRQFAISLGQVLEVRNAKY